VIEYLKGTCVARLSSGVILDVNGVGYGLTMPLSSLCEVSPGQRDLGLWVYTHVREDAIRLFGFPTYELRLAFEVLLSVNGVGPKVALAILSTLGVGMLKRAVAGEQLAALQSVPGVGPRLAERLLVELKPKLKKFQVAQVLMAPGRESAVAASHGDQDLPEASAASVKDAVLEDVRSALDNLGFKEKEINAVLGELAGDASQDFPVLLRKALSRLNRAQV
jgi:Holliday junction DNA helicase RuvA